MSDAGTKSLNFYHSEKPLKPDVIIKWRLNFFQEFYLVWDYETQILKLLHDEAELDQKIIKLLVKSLKKFSIKVSKPL